MCELAYYVSVSKMCQAQVKYHICKSHTHLNWLSYQIRECADLAYCEYKSKCVISCFANDIPP